jgi:rhamnosyltransferase subunit B
MLAILSAPGSRGDVNPMVAIGRQLRAIGFEVVISLAEVYAPVARSAGLQVEPIIDRREFDAFLNHPHLWKPIRGARTVFRVAADILERHDEVIRRHHRPGQTVLVAHPLDFASRIFHDASPDTPMASIHLAPTILRTPHDPPRLSPWRFELSRPEFAVRSTYWLADHVMIDPVLRPQVNRLRARYGLDPVRRVADQWWLSPERIVAFYPDWFAPATESFGPRLVHAGFPLNDADDRSLDPPGDRPIVFTAGTANRHARRFLAAAADACERLGRPGLLVSSEPESFPASLPPGVRTSGYAPFGALLPHCAAIVHHGGIGTTSQAMAAGIPQLIRPLAFDQFDNAARVRRLGCGEWVRRDSQLVAALERVLDAPQVARVCGQLRARLAGSSAAAVAAETIRRMIA